MSSRVPAARQVAPRENDEALAALARIAERLDPFDFVPCAGVTGRIVTLGPFHLRPAEYDVVMGAGRSSPVLLANLTPYGVVGRGPTWRVAGRYPFEELKADSAWDGISQSVLWDSGGSWLVVVSNEGHGIVAGDRGFVEDVERRLPHRSEDLVEIVDRLVAGRPQTREADDRILSSVARLYGPVEARRVRSATLSARADDRLPTLVSLRA
jgi:hypothetical protein